MQYGFRSFTFIYAFWKTYFYTTFVTYLSPVHVVAIFVCHSTHLRGRCVCILLYVLSCAADDADCRLQRLSAIVIKRHYYYSFNVVLLSFKKSPWKAPTHGPRAWNQNHVFLCLKLEVEFRWLVFKPVSAVFCTLRCIQCYSANFLPSL